MGAGGKLAFWGRVHKGKFRTAAEASTRNPEKKQENGKKSPLSRSQAEVIWWSLSSVPHPIGSAVVRTSPGLRAGCIGRWEEAAAGAHLHSLHAGDGRLGVGQPLRKATLAVRPAGSPILVPHQDEALLDRHDGPFEPAAAQLRSVSPEAGCGRAATACGYRELDRRHLASFPMHGVKDCHLSLRQLLHCTSFVNIFFDPT